MAGVVVASYETFLEKICAYRSAVAACILENRDYSELVAPGLNKEELSAVVRDIRRAFLIDGLTPSKYGCYYEMLYEIGAPMYPEDPVLMNRKYNVDVNKINGLQESSEGKKEIMQNAVDGHRNILQFSRLTKWASTVSAHPDIGSVPRVSIADFIEPISPHIDFFPIVLDKELSFAADSVVWKKKVQDAAQLAGTYLFAKLGVGYGWIALHRSEPLPKRIDINLNSLRAELVDLGSIYRSAMKPFELNKCLGHNCSDIDCLKVAIELALNALAVAPLDNIAFGYYIGAPFLFSLDAAIQADSRIVDLIDMDLLLKVFERQLDILNSSSDVLDISTAECVWRGACSVISSMHYSISGSLKPNKPVPEIHGARLLKLAPVLSRAIKGLYTLSLTFLSLEVVYLCFLEHCLPDEVLLYILAKPTFNTLKKIALGSVEFPNHLASNQIFGYIKADGDTVRYTLPEAIRCLREETVRLIDSLCRRCLRPEIEPRGTVTESLGKQLIKGGVIELLIELAKLDDIPMLRLVSDTFTNIVHHIDCALLLYHANGGIDLVRRMIRHEDPHIALSAFFILCSVIMDAEWRMALSDIPICDISARWAVAAIRVINEYSNSLIQTDILVKSIRFYRESSHRKYPPSGQEEQIRNYWASLPNVSRWRSYGGYYPPAEASLMKREDSNAVSMLSKVVFVLSRMILNKCFDNIGRSFLQLQDLFIISLDIGAYTLDVNGIFGIYSFVKTLEFHPTETRYPQQLISTVIDRSIFRPFKEECNTGLLRAAYALLLQDSTWDIYQLEAEKALVVEYGSDEFNNTLKPMLALLRICKVHMHDYASALKTAIAQSVVIYECACCGQAASSMKCGQCQVARYCSKECQKTHWKVHKVDCVKLLASEVQSA